MERMNQFDVIDVQGSLGVIVESHLLAPDKTVVAIPLMRDYPTARLLNPTFTVDGMPYVLATRLIASIPKGLARPTGDNVARCRDDIIRAIDVMVSGV